MNLLAIGDWFKLYSFFLSWDQGVKLKSPPSNYMVEFTGKEPASLGTSKSHLIYIMKDNYELSTLVNSQVWRSWEQRNKIWT